MVVGSGPNGLAAAVTLTAAGLRVLVIEGAPQPGGGCRTDERTLPGFRHDTCSAAHPLALASPFFRRFDLAARGVRLLQPEIPYAHPLDGGRAALARRSVMATAAGLGPDGPAYRRLFARLAAAPDDLVAFVLGSGPRLPHRPVGLAAFLRHGLEPASAVAGRFSGDLARALFAGVAAHAIRPLSSRPTAGVGLLLGSLAHAVGWPVVEGGSGRLTAAMVAAVEAGGGRVETGRWVASLAELPAARAVLLDVTPRALVGLAGRRLPGRYRRALERFRYGAGVCKVDFALAGPVPWANPACRRAGTLHLGGAFQEVAAAEATVAGGGHPDRPYVLAIQAGVVDPSRAPTGRHTLWTYCHVPAGSTTDMTQRIEAQVERFAPGFRELVLARAGRTAVEVERDDPNAIGGDIAAGMQDLRQSVFRPMVRWNPHRTPLPGVYLCSASTAPGPGVHGLCGARAARAALRDVFGIRADPDLAPQPLDRSPIPAATP